MSTNEGSGEKRRIVAIGGGTGMHVLLSGLRDRDVDLCAIITVADDGGSSGRLRKDFNIPPPGDIRNCLVALSTGDPILRDLFQYRFETSIIKGHSFGNLFIATLTNLTGDFREAIERAGALLRVRGKVIPATEQMVVLVAEHPDGTKSTGETVIGKTRKPMRRIRLMPKPPPVSDEIVEQLSEAELICIGPGSLYTSIVPNLLVPGMVEAINASPARVVYVANLMTQPGETEGFDLADHVRVLTELEERLAIDMLLCPSDAIPADRAKRYAEEGAIPVTGDDEIETLDGIPIRRAQLVDPGQLVRHRPEWLASAVLDCLKSPGGAKTRS